MAQALTQRIEAVNQQAIAEGRIVGSVVLVAQQGAVIYAGASGYADREQRQPMQRNSQFRLSSVSKPYTTLAALRLIEQQLLSLDDAVSRWLPWFTPALPDGRRPAIAIRHLLTHTAGLDYRFKQPEGGIYQRLRDPRRHGDVLVNAGAKSASVGAGNIAGRAGERIQLLIGN